MFLQVSIFTCPQPHKGGVSPTALLLGTGSFQGRTTNREAGKHEFRPTTFQWVLMLNTHPQNQNQSAWKQQKRGLALESQPHRPALEVLPKEETGLRARGPGTPSRREPPAKAALPEVLVAMSVHQLHIYRPPADIYKLCMFLLSVNTIKCHTSER